MLDSAIKSAAEFPNLLNQILDLLRRKSPVQILATLSAYGLTASVGSDGVQNRSLIPDLHQHHIELLQALALSIPGDEWGDDVPIGGDIQLAIETVVQLSDAFHQRRRRSIDQELDKEKSAILALQEKIRLNTQGVRNWGYMSHVVDISQELFGALDQKFRDHYGFSATDLVSVAKFILSAIEVRLNERHRSLRDVLKQRSIRQLVRRYFKATPGITDDPAKFITLLPKDATIGVVKAIILAHSELFLVDLYSVSIDEVVAGTSLPRDSILKIFASMSIAPDALATPNVEHFFLDNPTWHRPFVGLGEDLFCPVPMMFFSHIHAIMFSLAEDAGLKVALERRRATYLEDKVTEIFGRVFPKAQMAPNAKWKDGAIQYENDLVAVIDRVAIIIEEKSHALSGAGLRGAPGSVKRHVRDLVVEPAQQSARLATVIRAAAANGPGAIATLKDIPVDFAGVDIVVRISVTLDDFSVVSSSERALREAGWVPDGTELAPTVTLADLQCILEILSQPVLFLHYFSERARFQKALDTIADEMDFLGFYLDTGFNTLGTESQVDMVDLSGISGLIDRYFEGRDQGIALPKPAPNLTPYFRQLIERMQERGKPGWLLAGLDLLRSASFDEQKQLDAKLAQLRAMVLREWREPTHKCSVVISPPTEREAAIVFHVHPKQLATSARGTAEELAADVLDRTDYRRCVVISRSADDWGEPYSSVCIVTRPK